jgi:hypothetical protein
MLLQKRGNAIRRPRSLINPEVDPLDINAKVFFVILAYGVKKPKAFNVPAVTSIAGISDYQVIKGAFFRASARKSNTNHYISV